MLQGLAAAMQGGSQFDQRLRDASPLLMAMGSDLQRGTPGASMPQGLAAMMQMRQQREMQQMQAQQAQRIQGAVQQLPPDMRAKIGALPPEMQADALAKLATQQAQGPKRYRVGDQLVDDQGNVVYSATAPGPTFRPLAPEEAAQFGVQAGQIDTRTGRVYPIDAPQGMTIESDGAGGFRMVQGAGVQQKPFTEGQSKDVVYATRARGALEAFEPIADRMASVGDRALNADPTGMLRGRFQSPEFQVAQNAGNEFLQAILRKDTGAAITEQEQALYGQTYLPQPGDGPEVIQEKARARQRAIAAIEAGMSPAQMIAQEKGLNAAKQAAPQGVDPEDWKYMSEDERALFGGQGAENPSEPREGLVNKIAFVESGNNPTARNPRSSATGAGQFIDATWLEMIRAHRPELARGKSRDEVLALRNDPALSKEMIDRYASQNAQTLARGGFEATPGNLYLAHFAGPGGALAALRAAPDTPVEKIMGRRAVEANPFLRGKTAGWLVQWAKGKMNGGTDA